MDNQPLINLSKSRQKWLVSPGETHEILAPFPAKICGRPPHVSVSVRKRARFPDTLMACFPTYACARAHTHNKGNLPSCHQRNSAWPHTSLNIGIFAGSVCFVFRGRGTAYPQPRGAMQCGISRGICLTQCVCALRRYDDNWSAQ